MQEHKKSPETADNVCFRGFFISAASDAPVEDTDIPEDLYPDLTRLLDQTIDMEIEELDEIPGNFE